MPRIEKPTPGRKLHPFVAQLRDLRIAQGESQYALAKRMGYTEKAVEKWESGRRVPMLFSAIDWATALGKTLTIL